MLKARISKIGIYDKKKAFPTLKTSPLRGVDCFEIEYVLRSDSDCTLYIDGETYPSIPNTIYVRKPGQTSQSKSYFTCFFIHFEVEKGSRHYDTLINMPSYFAIVNADKYREIFERLVRHSIKTNCVQDDYILAKLLELLYYLGEDTIRNRNLMLPQPHKQILHLRRAIAYIKENFHLPLNLATLADICGYTPNHFRQVFTKSMGVSPQKHLENVRIQHAKYLLTQSEKSIAEVAYECGFSSQSYFSTLFKKYTLATPHEFRESVSSNYPDVVISTDND